MRVLLVIAGSPEQTYVLAAGAARGVGTHMGPAGLSHNSRILTQVAQPLRGAFSKPRSRGNITTQLAFTVKVELATVEVAAEYAMLYPVQLPREGTLRILVGAGETERRIDFADAVIETVDIPRPLGVSLEITYRIMAGAPLPVTWPNEAPEAQSAAEPELQGQAGTEPEMQPQHAAESEMQPEAT